MFDVIRADLAGSGVRRRMAEIFAEGFSQWLGFFSKDPDRIAAAFAHSFVLDQFYVALYEGEVAGMVACTDGASLSLKLDKKELRKHLGYFKGTLAGIFLKKEFESTTTPPLPPGTGSIEFVGTAAEFKGRGVASRLIRHILEHTPYETYVINEVADTNIPAMKLYEKLGFEEYKRKEIPVKQAKKIGIHAIVSFRLSK